MTKDWTSYERDTVLEDVAAELTCATCSLALHYDSRSS
jgi:hypothetical protein